MYSKPPSFILIPYQLIADTRIKHVDQVLYGVIYWMTKLKNEKCTAGNDTLAEIVGTTPGVITNSLTKLEKAGYIYRTFKDRNKRIREDINPLIDFNQIPVPKGSIRKANKPSREEDAEIVTAFIREFEKVNPSYGTLIAHTSQRQAVKRMMKAHGMPKLEKALQYAISVYGKDMAPVITTPIDLEKKLGALVSYYKRSNSKGSKMIEI